MARQLLPNPFDRLTPAEQRIFEKAFRRRQRRGREVIELRPGVGVSAITRAARIKAKIDKMGGVFAQEYPKPPSLNAWMIWHYRREKGVPLDSLIADDSLEGRPHLNGNTVGSRKTEAIRKDKAVARFRRDASPWWRDVVSLHWQMRARLRQAPTARSN